MPNSHGTKAAYDKDGCRCETCKSAKRARDRDRREKLRRRVKEGDASLTHGTATLYSKGNCRCEPCALAYAEHQARWRERNPGKESEYAQRWRAGDSGKRNLSKRKVQALRAPRSGYIWTGADLETVVTRVDLTDAQLADMLGRSLNAVAMARFKATHDPKWIKAAGVDEA